MRSGHWLLLLRLCALTAVAASTALLIDYTTPAEAFCGADSACAKVRGSGYGYLLNGRLPVPAIGLAGFAVLFLLSLWKDEPRARQLMLFGAYSASALGLVLIALQVAVVGQLCWLCLVADVAGIGAGSAAIMWRRAATEAPGGPELQPWALAALGLLAVGSPLLWPRFKPQPPVPRVIAELYQPGKINVVEFFDFECPHCRSLHPQLMQLKQQYAGRVHFVRKNYPLAFHAEAMPSAKGHICAAAQGKGEEFADKLLRGKHIGAIPARMAAQSLGLDLPKYEACIADPATEQQIQAEMKLLKDAGMQGLPTTYIGGRRIIGNQPQDVFADAFRRAEEELETGQGEQGVPAPLFAGIALAIFLGVGFAGRRREEPAAATGATPSSGES